MRTPPPIEAGLLLRLSDLLEGHLISNHLPTANEMAWLFAKWRNLADFSQARGAHREQMADIS